MTLTEVAACSVVVGLLVCVESVLAVLWGMYVGQIGFIVVMLVYVVEEGVVLEKLSS